MKTKFLLLLFLSFFVSFYAQKKNLSVSPVSGFEIGKIKGPYKVIGVKDGDTVELLIDNKPQTVRLAHVDAPEKNQPFGQKAKTFVSAQCFGKKMNIIPTSKPDRYGRWIVEIVLPNKKILNKELIENGLAWHFKKYSKSAVYANLETEARRAKVGLWKDLHPIAPWDWRKPKKRAELLKNLN